MGQSRLKGDVPLISVWNVHGEVQTDEGHWATDGTFRVSIEHAEQLRGFGWRLTGDTYDDETVAIARIDWWRERRRSKFERTLADRHSVGGGPEVADVGHGITWNDVGDIKRTDYPEYGEVRCGLVLVDPLDVQALERFGWKKFNQAPYENLSHVAIKRTPDDRARAERGPVDTSDEACALICMTVSNPQGAMRKDGDGWQRQVNDLIRALRDERNELKEAAAAKSGGEPVPAPPLPRDPRIGDLVYLKSGGPRMTVTSVKGFVALGTSKVSCAWFYRNQEVKDAEYPVQALLNLTAQDEHKTKELE